MIAVDTFIKLNRDKMYDPDFRGYRTCRVHPNPLFTLATIEIREPETEICPCCEDKNNLGLDSWGRKKKALIKPVA